MGKIVMPINCSCSVGRYSTTCTINSWLDTPNKTLPVMIGVRRQVYKHPHSAYDIQMCSWSFLEYLISHCRWKLVHLTILRSEAQNKAFTYCSDLHWVPMNFWIVHAIHKVFMTSVKDYGMPKLTYVYALYSTIKKGLYVFWTAQEERKFVIVNFANK